MADPLIYNRTIADKARAEELKSKLLAGAALTQAEVSEYLAGLRGSPNYTDFNRVEEWIQLLKGRLESMGYYTGIDGLRAWAVSDMMYQPDIDLIRENIVKLRDCFFRIPEWRDILIGDRTLSMEQANSMEWDLQMCLDWIENVISIGPWSGMANISCGSVFYPKGAI